MTSFGASTSTLGTWHGDQLWQSEVALAGQTLARAVVEGIQAGADMVAVSRALAELARGGLAHEHALEVLSGGPQWPPLASLSLAEAVLATPQSASKKLTTELK